MVVRTAPALAVALALLAAVPAPAARGRPDLRPAAPRIVGERAVAPDGSITLADAVGNRGRRRAPATQTRFVLSRDAAASAEDLVLGSRRVRALRRRAVSRRTLTLVLPRVAAGSWRLVACADASRRVRERRERDNCRAALLPVRVLDPPAPPPPPPPPAEDPRPGPLPRTDPIVLPLLGAEPEPEGPVSTDPASVRDCDPVTPEDDEPADAFTAMFADTSRGWTGGDGTFSVRLPGGETAWLFGDTFLGGLTTIGGRDQPYPDVRNTLVVQDDACLTTHFRGTLDAPSAFAIAREGTWFWPNQPVVHGDAIRMFWTRMDSEPAPFAVDGVELATYDADLGLQSIAEVPALPGQWWGAAFVDADPYTYVFGIRDTPRSVLLARTALHDLDATWEYRTGTGWSQALADAEPVLADAGRLSTQISVVPDGAGWALVSQEPLGSVVHVWRATEPWSWGPPEELTTLDPVIGAFSYNALAHPAMTAGGELLLSYNVNADSTLVMADASLYRPRFVRAALP